MARWIARLRISATGPGQAAGDLSGGNQQKVALARLLHQQADVLLLDEPTRGIDVGSKAEIYRLIGELAAQGKAILVVSSYLPELFGICDRIAVMSRGALARPAPSSAWTEHEVMEVATAATRTARSPGIAEAGVRSILRAEVPTSEEGNRRWPPASTTIAQRASRHRACAATLGWVWTVFGPFLGLVLITALFAVLTRESGRFLTVENWRTIAVHTGDRGHRRPRHDDHHDRRAGSTSRSARPSRW